MERKNIGLQRGFVIKRSFYQKDLLEIYKLYYMRKLLALVLSVLLPGLTIAQTSTVHVFVALCDNEHQGIVPVPAKLGNGKDPKNNLYWGATYGVKSYFRYKSNDWELLETLKSDNPAVLERVLFKHSTKDIYILADAYDGEKIKYCVEDFLKAANEQTPNKISYKSKLLKFGGGADLLAYLGHDGLMDFGVQMKYGPVAGKRKDVMILACISKVYFSPEIRKAHANPILWATGLMAPEAYTLKSAIDGWILNESGNEIAERAAQAYNLYQTCGIRGARYLFATGF